MKTYSQEYVDKLIESLSGMMSQGEDNEGQLIIYTNIYSWKDGTYHDEPELDEPDLT